MKIDIKNTLNPGQQPGRQGDVMLKCIDIEKFEIDWSTHYKNTQGELFNKDRSPVILAYGEKTGHQHAFYDGNVVLVKGKNKETGNETYILTIVKESIMKHGCNEIDRGDHSPIRFPIGYYEVIKQREYVAGKIINVAD